MSYATLVSKVGYSKLCSPVPPAGPAASPPAKPSCWTRWLPISVRSKTSIAEPEMRLYLTDLVLERARLALDVPASVVRYARAEAAR